MLRVDVLSWGPD